MMDLVGNLDYVLVYVDDILSLQRHSETEEEDHLKKMEEVLQRLNVISFRASLCSYSSYNKRLNIWGSYLS